MSEKLYYLIEQTVDLARENAPKHYAQPLISGDSDGHKWCVRIRRQGADVPLEGYTASVYIKKDIERADGTQEPVIYLPGTVDASTASAVLAADVYALNAPIIGVMRVSGADGQIVTTAILYAKACKMIGSKISDPTGSIKSLEELLAEIETMEKATTDSLAAAQEARSAAAEAVQTAEAAGEHAVSLAQAAGVQAIANANTAGAEAKATAETAAQEARDAAEEAVQTAEAAGTQAVSLAQAAGVQAISNANTAGAEAKATAETAAAKADAAREAIEGDLGAIEAALLTKAPAIECEASGSILTVPDAAAQPAVQLISHIVPVQEGSGDPSPENVRPISGWNAVKVRRTGKNLIDANYNNTAGGINVVAADGLVTINGEITSTSSTNMTLASNVKLKAGTYSLSSRMIGGSVSGWENGSTMFRIYKGTSNTVLASTKYNVSDVDKFTLSEDTDVRFTFLRASYSVTYNNLQFAIQIECGSEATEFEPPNIQTLTADLPGTVYGGSLDWKTGTLTVEPYDLATFDGSEDFQIPASHTNTVTQVFTCVEVKVSNKASFTSTRSKSRSNMFRPIVRSDYAGLRENTFYWADASGAWRFGWGAPGATVEEFTAFLQANPLQILVPTTKKTKEYQLTPQQLELLKGLNNVWSDTGDTSLVYVADTKMYIDGKISELVTLALAEN